jgi:TonB family protein
MKARVQLNRNEVKSTWCSTWWRFLIDCFCRNQWRSSCKIQVMKSALALICSYSLCIPAAFCDDTLVTEYVNPDFVRHDLKGPAEICKTILKARNSDLSEQERLLRSALIELKLSPKRSELQIGCFNRLAINFVQNKQLLQAVSLADELQVQTEWCATELQEASLHYNLGSIYLLSHRFEQVDKELISALDIFSAKQASVSTAYTLAQLGASAEKQKLFHQALDYYQKAAQEFSNNKDSAREQIICLHDAACMAFRQNDNSLAAKLMLSAAKISETAQNLLPGFRSKLYFEAGLLFCYAGYYEQASNAAKNSVKNTGIDIENFSPTDPFAKSEDDKTSKELSKSFLYEFFDLPYFKYDITGSAIGGAEPGEQKLDRWAKQHTPGHKAPSIPMRFDLPGTDMLWFDNSTPRPGRPTSTNWGIQRKPERHAGKEECVFDSATLTPSSVPSPDAGLAKAAQSERAKDLVKKFDMSDGSLPLQWQLAIREAEDEQAAIAKKETLSDREWLFALMHPRLELSDDVVQYTPEKSLRLYALTSLCVGNAVIATKSDKCADWIFRHKNSLYCSGAEPRAEDDEPSADFCESYREYLNLIVSDFFTPAIRQEYPSASALGLVILPNGRLSQPEAYCGDQTIKQFPLKKLPPILYSFPKPYDKNPWHLSIPLSKPLLDVGFGVGTAVDFQLAVLTNDPTAAEIGFPAEMNNPGLDLPVYCYVMGIQLENKDTESALSWFHRAYYKSQAVGGLPQHFIDLPKKIRAHLDACLRKLGVDPDTIQSRRALIKSALQKGDLITALAETSICKELCIRQNKLSDATELAINEGNLYLTLGQPDQAISHYRPFAPKESRASAGLARAYSSGAEWKVAAASQHYIEAISANPTEPSHQAELLDVCYRDVLHNPENSKSHLRLAEALLLMDDFSSAAREGKYALRLNPANGLASEFLDNLSVRETKRKTYKILFECQSYVNKKNFQPALAECEYAAQLIENASKTESGIFGDNEIAHVFYDLATLQLLNKQPSKAAESLDRCLKLSPLFAQTRNFKLESEAADKQKNLLSQNYNVINNAALQFWQESDVEHAIKLWQCSSAIQARWNLAVAFFQLGKIDNAFELFSDTELCKARPAGYFWSGICSEFKCDRNTALVMYSKYLGANKDQEMRLQCKERLQALEAVPTVFLTHKSYKTKQHIHSSQVQINRAIADLIFPPQNSAYYKRLFAISPSAKTAYRLSKTVAYPESINWLTIASKLSPENQEYRDALTKESERKIEEDIDLDDLGAPGNARLLKNAVKQFPNYLPFRLYFAGSLVQNKKFDEAVAELEFAKKLGGYQMYDASLLDNLIQRTKEAKQNNLPIRFRLPLLIAGGPFRTAEMLEPEFAPLFDENAGGEPRLMSLSDFRAIDFFPATIQLNLADQIDAFAPIINRKWPGNLVDSKRKSTITFKLDETQGISDLQISSSAGPELDRTALESVLANCSEFKLPHWIDATNVCLQFGARGLAKIPNEPEKVLAETIDFGPFMSKLQEKIVQHWRWRAGTSANPTVVSFWVSREGKVVKSEISKSCGNSLDDENARKAIADAAPYPLPKGSPEPISIEFTFTRNKPLTFADSQSSLSGTSTNKEEVPGPFDTLNVMQEPLHCQEPIVPLNFPPLPLNLDLPKFDARATARLNDETGNWSIETNLNSVLNNNLAVLLAKRNFQKEAIKIHEDCLRHEPDNLLWRSNLSLAHLSYGKYLEGQNQGKKANDEFNLSLATDRKNETARLYLRNKGENQDSQFCLLDEANDLAQNYLQELSANSLDSNGRESLVNQSYILLELGLVPLGFEYLNKAVSEFDWQSNEAEYSKHCTKLGDILLQYARFALEKGDKLVGCKRLLAAGIQYRRAVLTNPENLHALHGFSRSAKLAVEINPSAENRRSLSAARSLLNLVVLQYKGKGENNPTADCENGSSGF